MEFGIFLNCYLPGPGARVTPLAFDPTENEWAIMTDGQVVRCYRPRTCASSCTGTPRCTWTRPRWTRTSTGPRTSPSTWCSTARWRTCAPAGIQIIQPSDPLHDADFIRAVTATYSIAPTHDLAKEVA